MCLRSAVYRPISSTMNQLYSFRRNFFSGSHSSDTKRDRNLCKDCRQLDIEKLRRRISTILPAFTLGDSIQFGIAFSQVLYHLRAKKPTVRILRARDVENLVIRILTDLAQLASRLSSTRLESLGLCNY